MPEGRILTRLRMITHPDWSRWRPDPCGQSVSPFEQPERWARRWRSRRDSPETFWECAQSQSSLRHIASMDFKVRWEDWGFRVYSGVHYLLGNPYSDWMLYLSLKDPLFRTTFDRPQPPTIIVLPHTRSKICCHQRFWNMSTSNGSVNNSESFSFLLISWKI